MTREHQFKVGDEVVVDLDRTTRTAGMTGRILRYYKAGEMSSQEGYEVELSDGCKLPYAPHELSPVQPPPESVPAKLSPAMLSAATRAFKDALRYDMTVDQRVEAALLAALRAEAIRSTAGHVAPGLPLTGGET